MLWLFFKQTLFHCLLILIKLSLLDEAFFTSSFFCDEDMWFYSLRLCFKRSVTSANPSNFVEPLHTGPGCSKAW